MSESATTIIKLLSALTSPKAAVKYISVAIFIVFSWKYFSDLAEFFGTPEENIAIVVLLAGVGLGSIFGELITWIGGLIWQSMNKKLKVKKLAKQALEEKAANDQKRSKANEAILRRYKDSFDHLGWESKEKLRELTIRDITLDFGNVGFKTLFENKYINVVSQISNKTYLVKLNPILFEITNSTWEKEIEAHVDDYFFEMSPEKTKILDLMEVSKDDDDSIIDFDIKSILSPYYSCIRREAEDENGFWLCFRSYYSDEFSKRTGKNYKDETWIKRERIIIPAINGLENA